MKRQTPILRHAAVMVLRTLKSYALLSVTIIMSFSLFLGYLAYTDTAIYNNHKSLFSQRRGDVFVKEDIGNKEKVTAFLAKAKEIGNTISYTAYKGLGGRLRSEFDIPEYQLPDNTAVWLSNWQLFYFPDYAWLENAGLLTNTEIVWVDGREDNAFILASNECVINESTYYALGLDQMDIPSHTFHFESGVDLELIVVGYVEDIYPISFDSETGREDASGVNQLILSTKLLDVANLWDVDSMVSYQYLVIHSDSPEHIVELAYDMKFDNVISIYKQQNDALETIRVEKQNKAIIACALLLLLGINLYSSFTNALNDRKFEVGVKRAIGASSWCIVRQFLYESLLVMAVNIAISIVLVTDIAIIYKYICEHIPNEWGQYSDIILYISPYSVGMFAICATTLTIVFSLIFAYKSTQVEIVKYLKSE